MQRVVVVLGMHRSGTSLVTRGLQVLRVELGDNLLGPAFDNPKGFWEDRDLLAVNEQVLDLLGSAYDRPGLHRKAREESVRLRPLKLFAVDLIRKRFGREKIWGFKDPRTARVLPFWQDVFSHLGMADSYVIVVRNPRSVARSLEVRNSFDREKSDLLWLEHMIPAVSATHGKLRVLVDYDLFLMSPTAQLQRIGKSLELPIEGLCGNANNEFVDEFVSEDLRHSHYAKDDLELDACVSKLTREAFDLMEKLARDEIAADGEDFRRSWNVIQEKFEALIPVYSFVGALEQRYQAVGTLLHEEKRARDALEARLSSLEVLRAEQEGQITSLNQAVAERESQIAGLNQAVAERESQIASLNQVLAVRDEVVKGLDVKLEQGNRENEGLRFEVRALRDSTSWKVTAPIRWCSRGIRRCGQGIRSFAVAFLRVVYHSLPFPAYRKNGLKGWFYSKLPLVFRHTVSYRYWKLNQPVDALRPKSNGLQKESKAQGVVQYLSDLFSYSDDRETYVPLKDSPKIDPVIRLIAFYLPQFHSIPENDEWWGKGFSEWRNVTRAKPQFVGHYQPHLPGELGFYDLRLIEIQKRQIELARMYGIYGFCYHYYWFGGKRLLERPLNQVLANKELDFPFCICWANENWTRRWDGLEEEVLIGQNHSPEDDLAFIQSLEPALRDDRYIRIGDRPLIIVYRPELLPEAKATVNRWRSYCHEVGIGEIYLALTHAFENRDPRDFGFDAAIEFPPNNSAAPTLNGEVELLNPNYRGIIYDYRYFLERSRKYKKEDYKLFRGVTPGWDNEARKPGRGTTFLFSTPDAYAEWLDNACRATLEEFEGDERIIFVNAWNEWAEGCHLEPDQKYGYAYLQKTADALKKPARGSVRNKIVCVSHDAYLHGAQLIILNIVKVLRNHFGYDIALILLGDGPLEEEFKRYAKVYNFHSGFTRGEDQKHVIETFISDGYRLAICNTSVVGNHIELLKEFGFKIVTLIHELPGIIKSYKLEDSIKKVAEHSDQVIFPAGIVQEKFIEKTSLSAEKCHIQPQGIYMSNGFKNNKDEARKRIRAELNIPQDARIVLNVGFADYRKGVDLFVEVGLNIIKQRSDVYFVWVGDRDPNIFEEVLNKIRKSNSDNWFRFTGPQESPGIYFAGSDLYLLTSREDPFPSVVLESLDVGVPVIAFENGGGFCDLLKSGTGFLAPYVNTDLMAGAAINLLSDANLYSKLSRNGQMIVERQFCFTDYVYKVLEIAGENIPRVSVVVPNYNYERYLPKRLKSIIDQSFRPYEIVFLDDCSSDKSVEVAEEILGGSGLPFRVIKNSRNEGCYKQWLKGIELAQGDLVWIAEADDYCDRSFLKCVLEGFKSEGVVLSYCQSKQIDENEQFIKENYFAYTDDISADKWKVNYIREGIKEIGDTLAIKNTIPNASAVVMKKPDLSSIRNRLAELRGTGDWFVYVHVLSGGKIAYFAEALNYHRRHKRSIISDTDALAHLKEVAYLQEFIRANYVISVQVREKAISYLNEVYRHFGLGPGCISKTGELPDLGELITARKRNGAECEMTAELRDGVLR